MCATSINMVVSKERNSPINFRNTALVQFIAMLNFQSERILQIRVKKQRSSSFTNQSGYASRGSLNTPFTSQRTRTFHIGSHSRPRLLTNQDMRHVEASIHHLRRSEQGVFTSVHIQEQSGTQNVSNRTVMRHHNRQGYGYRQCRKKGQLTDKDLEIRLKYA